MRANYSVGDQVECLPDMVLRRAAEGEYEILGCLPERGGERCYRIKSRLEEHERVVTEGLLRKTSK